jgi:hypothetical protein
MGSTMGPGSTSASDAGRTGGNMSRGTSSGTSSGTCAACGQSLNGNRVNAGLEHFLGRLGISEDMIQKLESSVSNIDVEEYLTTARDYLREGGGKAKQYAKEHPGQLAAGVAALAVGVGLLVTALNRE